MLSAIIQMFVQATYVGGVEAFNNDFNIHVSSNGEVVFAPAHDIELPTEFRAKFDLAAGGMGVKPIYATRSNFEGMSESEARDYLEGSLRCVIEESGIPSSLSASYALVEVEVKGSKDSPDCLEIQEALISAPEINNIRIQYADGEFVLFKGMGSTSVPNKYVSLATGRPDRDTVINKDDQFNLQIALGRANTVEEFLAMI